MLLEHPMSESRAVLVGVGSESPRPRHPGQQMASSGKPDDLKKGVYLPVS